MVQCGVPAVITSIPAGIPQLSDPSPRYSRNIHTHTQTHPYAHLQFEQDMRLTAVPNKTLSVDAMAQVTPLPSAARYYAAQLTASRRGQFLSGTAGRGGAQKQPHQNI